MPEQLALFDDNPLAERADVLDSLLDVNKKLSGGGGEYHRISIKGGKFRMVVNGEQISVSNEPAMNVIVVETADVGRTYYEGDYSADKVTAPVCWSNDTNTPAAEVESPQASRCADCPQNIKGSGQGNSRACRFSQRLAVLLEGDNETVYQLQLPATSLFGDVVNGQMPMQSYVRYLNAQAKPLPICAVVTEMSFDVDSEVPKLFFKPVRSVTNEELDAVLNLQGSDQVKRAIELTVSQTDGVQGRPEEKEEPKPKAKAKAKAKPKKEEAEPEEPTKMTRKSTAAPEEPEDDLASIVDGWDDE